MAWGGPSDETKSTHVLTILFPDAWHPGTKCE